MNLNPSVTNVYFSTFTNLNWIKILQKDSYKEIVLSSLQFLVKNERIFLYAFVIMPNHIHLIWKIRENHLLKDVQRDFLKFTAQKIKLKMIDTDDPLLDDLLVYSKDRMVQVWERNGLSFMLNDPETINQKLNYIHANPVKEKWSLSDVPENYYYSSASFYINETDVFEMLTHISEIMHK